MKSKFQYIGLGLAVLGLLLFGSCKRSGVDYPDPTGPSTLALLLDVSASPNVLYAGINRQDTNIVATLKRFNGSPLANETIHFEIRDEFGNRAYLGYLDNNQTVVSKVTSNSGQVYLTYTGPTGEDLIDQGLGSTDDFKLYIYAWVAWEGKELVTEWTPVVILKEIYDDTWNIDFDMQALPNVLWCTSIRPESEIRGIYKVSGQPVVGRKVFFKILSGPGKFSDGYTTTFAVTDENGIATVTFLGPTKGELSYDTFATISGQPETDWLHIYDPNYDPTSPPSYDYLHKQMDIRLIKGHD